MTVHTAMMLLLLPLLIRQQFVDGHAEGRHSLLGVDNLAKGQASMDMRRTIIIVVQVAMYGLMCTLPLRSFV